MPGVLAEKISYRMDFPTSEKRADFTEIINGLLLSLPIVLLAGIIFSFICYFDYLEDFIDAFDDLLFLTAFGITIFIIAVYIGVLKGIISYFWVDLVNKIRRKLNKLNIDEKSCWTKVLLLIKYIGI